MRHSAKQHSLSQSASGPGTQSLFLLVAAVLILNLIGCGTPAGIILEPVDNAPAWPGAPEPARIRYLGSIATSADLKPAKSFLESFGEAIFGSNEPVEMMSPYAVCVDDESRMFVADSGAAVVHMFDLSNRVYEQWRLPEGTHQLRFPVGLVYDQARDRLLVSDTIASTIFVFGHRGEYLGEIGSGHLRRPCGLAIDPVTDRIAVADSEAHQVTILAPNGELIRQIGSRGVALGQFNYPTNVAFDSQGSLYVSDSLNFRVQKFNSEFRPVLQIGRKGDAPGFFSLPKDLALDSEDHLYAVDANFEAVQIFDGSSGQLLLVFGGEGTGMGEFWLPAGIYIDEQNHIWIADTYNRRIQVFEFITAEEPS